MDEYTQAALDIVKAQASARPMTQDEIVSMVKTLASGFQAIETGQPVAGSIEGAGPAMDPKNPSKNLPLRV